MPRETKTAYRGKHVYKYYWDGDCKIIIRKYDKESGDLVDHHTMRYGKLYKTEKVWKTLGSDGNWGIK